MEHRGRCVDVVPRYILGARHPARHELTSDRDEISEHTGGVCESDGYASLVRLEETRFSLCESYGKSERAKSYGKERL